MRAYLTRPAADRLWEKVDRSGGPSSCWIWNGALQGGGYGHLGMPGGRWVMAHRLAYELLVGPIPAGLVLDHLCRTPRCVNPAHLEPVTNRENLLRSPLNRRYRTHCPHGHAYTPENTWTNNKNQRYCRTCRNAQMKARRQAA